LKAFADPTPEAFQEVPGVNQSILRAAHIASYDTYGQAYRLAWPSIIPYVALALIYVACLRSAKEKMTDNVQATVEHVHNQDKADEESTRKFERAVVGMSFANVSSRFQN
jgi:hypothetical protein